MFKPESVNNSIFHKQTQALNLFDLPPGNLFKATIVLIHRFSFLKIHILYRS